MLERWGGKILHEAPPPARRASRRRWTRNRRWTWTGMRDLTDGNADGLRELVEMFLKQTHKQFDQIEAAIQRRQGGRSPARGAQLRRRQRHAGHDAAGAQIARTGKARRVRRPAGRRTKLCQAAPAGIHARSGIFENPAGPGRRGQ